MVTIEVLVKVLRLAFVLALVVATASAVHAATATWDPNPEPNIAGYKLSYGTQPGVHGTTIDVGKVTTYQFNPPAGQRYYVVVQAYTTTGELSPKSAEAIVDIPPATIANRAPTLVQPPDQSSKQNTTVSLALAASDPDGNLLNYRSTGLPPGLSINAVSGVIAGVVSGAGTYPVTVTVSDGTLTASRSFTWTVTDAAAATQPNRAPTLDQPANQSSTLNAIVSLALIGSDPDGTTLTYTATGLPTGLSLYQGLTSGTIAGWVSKAGSYVVSVTVSDGALSVSRSFTWTVTEAAPAPQPNRAPTLNQPADQSSNLNAAVSLALVGSDPEGTALTYSSSGLPPGLSLNAGSGLITGTVSKAGSYPVSVTVSDGALPASRSFTWTVTDPAPVPQPNRAPTLNQPADQSSNLNAAVSLALVGSDPEGTALTYSSSGLPPGLSLNAGSGLITGTVSKAGSYPVSVTVSDGALSASRSFTWTVTDPAPVPQPNRAPTLDQPADQTSTLNAIVSLALIGSDPDGTTLTYTATGLPTGLSLYQGRPSGTIAGWVSKAGSYIVSVTVSDGVLSASRSFTWTVTAAVSTPTMIDASTSDAESGQPGVRLQTAGRLSGVTALQDGRLLLIENERSLSMLAPGSSVAQPVLDAGDAANRLTEAAVNTRFPSTRHVFVGVTTRLDADTSEFAVVRYREVPGSLGEGAVVVGSLRYRGLAVPRFTIDDQERIYVAMPETDRSDLYSAGILRFDADGSVPRENHGASPLFARGFSQPATLGWDGPSLVATGADQPSAHPAARINPGVPSGEWPQRLEPMSLGSSAAIVAAAFSVGGADTVNGLRAFIDSTGRLFRVSPSSIGQPPAVEEIPLSAGFIAVSAASGFHGEIYLIVRSEAGDSYLVEVRSAR